MLGLLARLSDKVACSELPGNLVEYVNGFWQRLYAAGELASEKLTLAQKKMKRLHDNKTEPRVFSSGDQATVTYLGRIVGQGRVCVLEDKVRALGQYPALTTKKELQRFLGLVGYYRNFCKNFSTMVAPLTDLLKGKVWFVWSTLCQKAFDNVKSLLCSTPVLMAPCMDRPFKLLKPATLQRGRCCYRQMVMVLSIL